MFLALEDGFACLNMRWNFGCFVSRLPLSCFLKSGVSFPPVSRAFLVNGRCMLNESDDSYLLLLREEEIWLSCG